jgi:hypothetical protein
MNFSSTNFGATSRQGIMRRLGCYADILKKKRGSLFRQISVLVCFKSFSGTRASSPVLLDVGYNAVDDVPTVKEEMSPP